MKAISFAAVGVASLLSFAACSSSGSKSASSSPDDSVPAGASVPANTTGDSGPAASDSPTTTTPPSKECASFILAKNTALSGDRTTMGELPNEYNNLSASYVTLAVNAPNDLKADFAVVSKTYGDLGALAKKAADIAAFKSNPDALKLIADSKFIASIARVTVYTLKTCPEK